MKKALFWTLFWVVLALLFALGIFVFMGQEAAVTFLSGYVLEKALSVDNLFLFLLIFKFFKLPTPLQKRVFRYGIWGAIIMRTIMILLGCALVMRFSWILYIFGAFLLITGLKMAFTQEDPNALENSRLIRWLQTHFRFTARLDGERFFVIENGLRYATPLFLALILIELTDLIFATDSIPAIFAITQDPFIIMTSNLFAILGLRSLYFVLAGTLDRFHFLRYGLACILSLVGVKLLITRWIHVPPALTLAVIISILAISMGVSFLKTKRKVGKI